MSRANEVYNYPRTLERELAKLRANSLGKKNSEIVLRFYRQLVAEGLGIARQIKYLYTLRRIASLLKRSFKETTKDDIIDFVAKIEQQEYSEWTKRDYKIILKRFYKWLRGCEEEYPAEVRWIKVGHNIPNTLQKKDLLTIDDIERIANSARNLRDKAFMWVYFESMRRLGEILTLRIGDVEFDEHGAFLNVTGKTGPRRVRIIKSVPLLTILWLNCHRYSKNPNAPLWVRLNNPEMKFMATPTVRSFLKKVVRKAGIDKRVHPHLFRHSRATHLASQIPESLLKKHMGWVQNSDMTATYVHLSGQELDKALLKASGIQIGEKPKEDKLNIIKCSRCGNDNSAGSKYCFPCGLCFDLKTAIEIDETKKKVDELLDALVKNPEKLEVLIELLQSNETDRFKPEIPG